MVLGVLVVVWGLVGVMVAGMVVLGLVFGVCEGIWDVRMACLFVSLAVFWGFGATLSEELYGLHG